MKETFPSLTGLRFPAALAVVVYHYGQVVEGFDTLPSPVIGAIACGPVSVALFFILSGFLLGSRYPEVDNPKAFWKSRFARLYPAYFFSFLLFLPIAYEKYIASAHRPDIFLESAVLNLTMLQSWTPLAQSWNGPSWSLSVEAFFYLVFPFVIHKLNRTGLRWFAVTGTVIFAMIGFAYGLSFISEPVWRSYLENNPILWLPLFILGIAAAWMLPAWRARVSARLSNVLLTLAMLCLVGLPFILPAAYRTGFIGGGAAAFLFVIILGNASYKGSIQNFLSSKLLLRLGSASYILYIVQAPCWHLYRAITNVFLSRPPMQQTVTLGQFLLFLPVLICLSILLERHLEKPLHRWILTRGKANSSLGPNIMTAMPIVPSPVQAPSAD